MPCRGSVIRPERASQFLGIYTVRCLGIYNGLGMRLGS